MTYRWPEWCDVSGLRHRITETKRKSDGAIVRTACGEWLIPTAKDAVRGQMPICARCDS